MCCPLALKVQLLDLIIANKLNILFLEFFKNHDYKSVEMRIQASF